MTRRQTEGAAKFRCHLSQQAVDSGLHYQRDRHGTRLGWAVETPRYFNVVWDGNVTAYYYAKSLIAKMEDENV